MVFGHGRTRHEWPKRASNLCVPVLPLPATNRSHNAIVYRVRVSTVLQQELHGRQLYLLAESIATASTGIPSQAREEARQVVAPAPLSLRDAMDQLGKRPAACEAMELLEL